METKDVGDHGEGSARKLHKRGLMSLTLRGLPELEQFADEAQREQALRELESEMADLRSLGFWSGVATVAFTPLAAMYAMNGVMRLVPWPRVLEELLVYAGAGAALWFMLRWAHRSGAQAGLRGKLVANGIPVCLACGYSLRGLSGQTPQCPECGKPIPEQVSRIMLNNSEK